MIARFLRVLRPGLLSPSGYQAPPASSPPIPGTWGIMGIFKTVLGLITSVIGIFWPSKSAEKVARDDGVAAGEAIEGSAVNSKAANTTAAMAQAETDAPQSKADILAALDKGAV